MVLTRVAALLHQASASANGSTGRVSSATKPLAMPIDGPKSRLDSVSEMSEMSEMTSMRFQMAMDRQSKFVEPLSKIMKQISDTSGTIVQNLKG